MVRISPQINALVGRLATPAPEKLGGRVEDKAKDFFREVGACPSCIRSLSQKQGANTFLRRPQLQKLLISTAAILRNHLKVSDLQTWLLICFSHVGLPMGTLDSKQLQAR